jgi:nucleoid-associated protein YgaU
MPKDVKFGLILVVGVALVCGVKRISLHSHQATASNTSPSTDALAIKTPTTPDLNAPALTLPDVPQVASKETKQIAKQVDATKDKAQKEINKATNAVNGKSDEAVTDLFPKDLRDKVKQSGEDAEKKLGDLELPSDFEAPAPGKNTPPAKGKSTLGNSKSSLPPVKSKDIKKDPPKAKTNDALTLPGDDFLKDSGLKDDSPAKSKSAPSDLDFPKPLPEATNASTGGGKGPAHPYFLRFVKEGSYFVRDGDTLRSIAYNLYQDESKAGEILELNRDVLKSPSDLKAGMRLQLPK